MGLTIHYDLALPAKTLLPDVRQKLGALRQTCLDLPFKEVGEPIELNGEECNFEKRDREDPLRWFLIQSDTTVHFKYDRSGKPVAVPGWQDGSYGRSVLPEHIVGFSTWPGEGCEEANIGLCRFPKTVSVQNKQTGKPHRLRVGDFTWRWQSFCKTQYANEHGLENFLRCHLTVIAMLDSAKRLGFEVEVNDESHYWEKRDIQALVKEIGQWDAFIAAFAGALKDTADAKGMTLESPITQRKDSDHLEAAGQSMIPPGMGAALQRLVGLTGTVASKSGSA
jgi:hypothetical protein